MTWYKPWTWAFDPKWPILSGLPSVQFRMVFLCGLDVATLWWLWHTTESIIHIPTAEGRATPLVLEIIIAWLAFLAGAHGFAFAGYRIKRNTSWDGNLEEDRGGGGSAARPPVNPTTGGLAQPPKPQEGA